jgi:hypothetical protein
MALNLYLIERDDKLCHYDDHHGHVIAAETESQARALAARSARDEGAQIWHEPTTTVVLIGTAAGDVRRAGIILTDNHDG